MVSQVERYYPRTRRAVGPVSQTDRFYDDTRNDVRCPYAEGLEDVSGHLRRRDNPHGVTAEQVGAVPLLGAGESADPATHGKTALVTQNGTQGGIAVSGKQGAKPEDDAFVTKYQRESITAFGADETEVERYLIGPQARNQDESILRVGDLAATKPVTVTPESVGYVQKVTLALQIDRETIAHANSADAIDWVPSSKAVKAALDQKAEKTHTHTTAQVTGLDAKLNAKADAAHTHTTAQVTGLDAALAQKANSADVYKKTETDGRYLQLTGGTLRGNVNASGSVTIKVPILHATDYFSTPMLCNEPGPYAKNHALLLGYAYHDYWEFLESGGDYRFYMHQETTGIHKQVARISEAGIYEGSTLLANKYAPKTHTHTQAQVTGLTAALQEVKDYADQRVTGVYRFKGSVATEEALPKTGNVTGDVWNVEADGQNWAWDGTKWDSLRGIVDLSAYDTAQTTQGKITAAVAPKANSADVYPKAQTYTKTEVDNLVAQAVAAAKTQLLEQLKGLYAPLSSVQATVGGTTYRWAWDDTFQTFAMQAVEA